MALNSSISQQTLDPERCKVALGIEGIIHWTMLVRTPQTGKRDAVAAFDLQHAVHPVL